VVGLRKFSIKEFLKKNINFLLGISSEITFALVVVVITMLISLVLVVFKVP